MKWYKRSCRVFSASCILHVDTLLSFSKLIPFLTICKFAMRRRTRPTLEFMTIFAFESHFTYVVILYSLSYIYGYCCLSFTMHHYFETRIHVSTICWVDVISGHDMYFIYMTWSYSFGRCDNPALWVCTPRLVYIYVSCCIYVYHGVEDGFGWYVVVCEVIRMVVVDWLRFEGLLLLLSIYIYIYISCIGLCFIIWHLCHVGTRSDLR